MSITKNIPVIDLFAGPGGLGEGFSSHVDAAERHIFRLALSVEKDPVAHRTLELRALFRLLGATAGPEIIYDHFRGDVSRDKLFAQPSLRSAVAEARREARCATLGDRPEVIDGWIAEALAGRDPWVLVGGPPCQAYSLVGRSRRTNESRLEFESDRRHVLYEEYLRIIRRFRPAVFVMENVKGILSSRLDGALVFERILRDLANPGGGPGYEIRSFCQAGNASPAPTDYVVRSEEYGVPQKRHRVILLGVREDLAGRSHNPLRPDSAQRTVRTTIAELPKLRSRLSRERDSHANWLDALDATRSMVQEWDFLLRGEVLDRIDAAASRARSHVETGGAFVTGRQPRGDPDALMQWLRDPRLGGYPLHESRGHMHEDIQRYLFVAAFGDAFGFSPKLMEFPRPLLPAHRNVDAADTPFEDRFRVQIWGDRSSTVVSHIAKDGHYYVHPDASQARSLTVREAARLQTFPDNYHFAGNRTEQFVQVGNAVPPFLARQLAASVHSLLAGGAGSSQLRTCR